MDRSAPLFTPVLIVGCIIIMVSFAVRASFGVFQIPIAEEFGWLRVGVSPWRLPSRTWPGASGSRSSAPSPRRSATARRSSWGRLSMPRGWCCRAWSTTPFEMQSYEWLVGFGIAGTGFGVVLAVVGGPVRTRTAPCPWPSSPRRALRADLWRADGGMDAGLSLSWQTIFLVFAGVVLALILTLLPLMRAPETASKAGAGREHGHDPDEGVQGSRPIR